MNETSRIYFNGADKIITDIEFLRQKSTVTTMGEVEQLKLIERLQYANGRAWTEGSGLAAIQIGVPLRFAWYRHNGKEGILLNPRITKGYGECMMREGCLSLPNKYTWVKRFVTIDYETNGKKKTANGFLARIIQHEIDHMCGILNIDKAEKEISGKKYRCSACLITMTDIPVEDDDTADCACGGKYYRVE